MNVRRRCKLELAERSFDIVFFKQSIELRPMELIWRMSSISA